MTMPPVTVGLAPINADEVNRTIGQHLRTFTDLAEVIAHDHDWLLSADLKLDPYGMSADQETLIKSAIADLDSKLSTVDMTFISRLTGLF
jgi:hypothetical protein